MIFIEAFLWNMGMIALGMVAIAAVLITLGVLSELLGWALHLIFT